MQSFIATALIVLAAVFCISHVDGSRASEVKSVVKRQVSLPPVRNIDEPCSNARLQRLNDTLICGNPSIGQQLLDVYAGCGSDGLALREPIHYYPLIPTPCTSSPPHISSPSLYPHPFTLSPVYYFTMR